MLYCHDDIRHIDLVHRARQDEKLAAAFLVPVCTYQCQECGRYTNGAVRRRRSCERGYCEGHSFRGPIQAMLRPTNNVMHAPHAASKHNPTKLDQNGMLKSFAFNRQHRIISIIIVNGFDL
eukprot:6185244-Pleurochrysis_carterae.AAC.2